MVRITLQDVIKSFGGTVAVDSINLVIEPGELFFLLGPSGCGKTTLMRMIAGLIDPTRGTILFGDRDVTHLPTSQRNTALVFQGYALWPHMTVAQNVAFGLEVRGVGEAEKKKRVDEALAAVRMSPYADRRPMQLSGGQQQRVALARAIVVRPDVLLLDEPLSNLDAKLRMEMRSEVRRICNETKITTVYVTHDQEEALSIADRMALLRDGKLLQVGTPQEIYARPRTQFVADFLGRANFISGSVAGQTGGQVTLQTESGSLISSNFPQNVQTGRQVTCCVRPESLRIEEGSGPAANRIAARYVMTHYLGHLAEHVFQTSGGVKITVEELKPKPRQWTAAPIQLAFDPSDVVVLTD